MNNKQVSLGMTAIAFGIYCFTLYPSLSGGDSGELITVAHTLGVAHPPGYPLYTLIAKLFTLIPIGNIAWRVNLLSALFSAISCGLLCFTVNRWCKTYISPSHSSITIDWLSSGILASGLFAFSPLVWRYSIQAEVFALNNLFVVTLLYFSLRYEETQGLRFVYAIVFLLGLSLSHHHTYILVGIPITSWVLWKDRKRCLQLPTALSLIGVGVLGLLPYLYLPWAAEHSRPSSWGNPSTWSGVWDHFIRKEYGTFQLTNRAQSKGDFVQSVFAYIKDTFFQSLFIGVVLAIWGLRKGLQKERFTSLLSFSLIAFLSYVIIFSSLANFDLRNPLFLDIQSRFWQVPNIFLFLWMGIGFSFLAPKLKGIWRVLLVGLTILLNITIHYSALDEHRNWLFVHFGKSILSDLPPRSFVLTLGDTFTNAVRYLQECEGLRPDIRIVDRELLKTAWMKRTILLNYPDLIIPGNVFRSDRPDSILNRAIGEYSLKDLFNANFDQRSIFVTSFDTKDDRTWEEEYQTWPWGFLNHVLRKHDSFQFEEYLQESEKQIPKDLEKQVQHSVSPGSWEKTVLDDYWDLDRRRSNRIITYGIEQNENPAMLHVAEHLLKRLIQRHPSPTPTLFKNLGIVYSHLLKTEPQAKVMMRETWTQYLKISPQDDPDFETIQKILSQQ